MTRSVTLPRAPVSCGQGAVQHRDRLGLRVPDASTATHGPRRTCSTNTNPNGQNFGNGHHRHVRRHWVDLTARPVGVCRPDGHARLPLLDRRRCAGTAVRVAGFPGGRHRDHRSADGRRRDRPGWASAGAGGFRSPPARKTSRSPTPTWRVPPVPRIRRRPQDRPVQLRVPDNPLSRTGSSTSRTRTACWSGTGTPQYTDNNVGDHCRAPAV